VIGELERYGFPKADPLFKARYAPAVRAWLDKQAGLSKIEPQVQDGQETWDDGGAKPDARANSAEAKIGPRSSLLERRQRLAESEGLSRPLDPFTPRMRRSSTSARHTRRGSSNGFIRGRARAGSMTGRSARSATPSSAIRNPRSATCAA
jgi:hypothetical protein